MISVKNLSKHFVIKKRKSGFWGSIQSLVKTNKETLKAVDDISFEMGQGELVGYIGPNGAGKSTTIKMLTGILKPSFGTISVQGLDPSKDRKRNAFQIGVVFGQRSQLWMDLPVEESFDLLKSIYKIDSKTFKNKVDFFSELLGLQDFYKQQARKLSLGQRMKADLAASLLHSPKILFLDEPTIGLDLLVKEKVREFIREINAKEKITIILTTHDIQDIEFLAKRIIIIDKGKIGYDGGISDFNKLVGNQSLLTVHFTHPIKDFQVPEPYSINKSIAENQYLLSMPDNEPIGKLLDYFQKRNYSLQELHREKPDLGDAIKKLYSGKTEL